MIHGHERDGAAWSGEWIALPQMAVAAGAAVARASELIGALTVDRQRMAENLAAMNGLAHAEAATFALARQMRELLRPAPRRKAVTCWITWPRHRPWDWQALGHPAGRIETAVQMLDEFLALDRRPPTQSPGKR